MDVKMKVGDKVKLVFRFPRTSRNHPLISVGDEGIVVHILESGKEGFSGYDITTGETYPLLYGVKWSKLIGGNNDCHGHCLPGYGAYMLPEEIRIIGEGDTQGQQGSSK